MPPKKAGKKKGKDAASAALEKPKTPEPTEKELLLQKEYALFQFSINFYFIAHFKFERLLNQN